MSLYIEIPSQKKLLPLKYDSNELIEDIKVTIMDYERIPPSDQILKLGDKILNDNRTLSDYSIKKEEILILELIERGVKITIIFKDI